MDAENFGPCQIACKGKGMFVELTGTQFSIGIMVRWSSLFQGTCFEPIVVGDIEWLDCTCFWIIPLPPKKGNIEWLDLHC